MPDDVSTSKTGVVVFVILCITLVTFAEIVRDRNAQREDLKSSAQELYESYESLDSLANDRDQDVLLIGRDTIHDLSKVKLKDVKDEQ